MRRHPSRRLGQRLFAVTLLLIVGAACTLSGINGRSGSPVPTLSSASPGAAQATTTAAASATSAGATATSVSGTAVVAATGTSGEATATVAPSTSAAPSLAAFQNAITAVVDKAKPAVVEITNEQTSIAQLSQPIPVGTGSGFIFDADGHVLTNNHVVEGAESLVVTLPDGRSFKDKEVRVVGTDPLTDLAVLQISGDNLPVISLGDSGQLHVGEWLVAMGYALGLEGQPSVTAGVASALGRTVQEPSEARNTQGPYLFDVIQTDAAINPGNSGGPLTNLNGEVVGINTLIAVEAEPGVQAEGIGFAIAINTAKKIADEIISTGHAVHPFVGVQYVPLTPAIAAQLNTSAKQGVLIQSVIAGSPAARAGLQQSDVVTEVDGKPLTTDSSFAEAIESHDVGDVITLTVLRDGQSQQIPVTLGQRPAGS
ncbi:MAG TPA: trypsin-like peptidase domain-containing protein [Thermomicrobiaceae bacterium]|nr:trypsin-like peptidase domain-containing protein [Thermomicrobiaceae bacterium]